MFFPIRATFVVISLASACHVSYAQQRGQAVYQAQAGTVPAYEAPQPPAQNNQPSQQPVFNSPQMNDSNPFAKNNRFLAAYDKQGREFSANVFEEKGGRLSRLSLSGDAIKKCVVVFIGDWCPHCEKFISTFAHSIDLLKSNGVKILFLAVPSIDRLRNWREPTIADYESVKQKVTSFGVRLGNGVQIVLLGDGATLARSGVEGLPVFLAIDEGKEKFRGTGEGSLSKVNLSDENVRNEFLEIWGKKAEQKDAAPSKRDDFNEAGTQKKAKSRGTSGEKGKLPSKKKNKGPRAKNGTSRRWSVNILEARRETDYLNRF
jgi:thiol-disulfide isomerase/thioredoxin